VQTDRDIKRRLGDRIERSNDKGRSILGAVWEDAESPMK
jgi:hypothetical protein